MQHLLEKLYNNDPRAFEEFYFLTHQKVYNFIFRYVKDEDQTQELVQSVFIKCWEKRRQFHPAKPLEAQLFVLTRNLTIDALRKMNREALLKKQVSTKFPQLTQNTEEHILFNNLEEHLDAAVEALPKRRQEIYRLSRQKGMTYREIAEELSISPKTVEEQMRQALKMIRTKLAGFLHTFF